MCSSDLDYREETLAPDAIVAEHGDDDADIIPAFPYGDGERFPGRNLTDEDALTLANGCVPPGDEPAPDPGEPYLDLTKTATDLNGAPLVPGDVIAFTITIANTGTAPAQEVAIYDAIPAGTDYVEGSAGDAEVRDGYLLATLGTLAPGASATVAFSVAVQADLPPGAVVLNLAHGSGVDPKTKDPLDPESNLIEIPVDVPPVLPAEIEVDPPAKPIPGSDIKVPVTADPDAAADDMRVCLTLVVARGSRLGYARETCTKPADVAATKRLRRVVRIRVPRFAAGRCRRLTTSVSAKGFSPRERTIRLCVRALPSGKAEAVTG